MTRCTIGSLADSYEKQKLCRFAKVNVFCPILDVDEAGVNLRLYINNNNNDLVGTVTLAENIE